MLSQRELISTAEGKTLLKKICEKLEGTPWFDLALEIDSKTKTDRDIENKYSDVWKEISDYDKQCEELKTARRTDKEFDASMRASELKLEIEFGLKPNKYR